MMEAHAQEKELIIRASLGRHLAFAPVGFAVTDGPAHALTYANAVFRGLQRTGAIGVGPEAARGPPSAMDLTPLLDRVYRSGKVERDVILESKDARFASRSCTVWPVPGPTDLPETLVIEVRDAHLIESARTQQREVVEHLLLSALKEQDTAETALGASRRAAHLAKASRDLSTSLDEGATRETVRRLTLPRPGTWCIVDVAESNGGIHRLAVVHPDPAKQSLARTLQDRWPSTTAPVADDSTLRATQPTVLNNRSGAALMLAAHGEENLRILRQIGFGSLLL